MCLPLVARVIAVADERAEVELLGDDECRRVFVSAALFPDLVTGEYALVDRGMVIERIDAEQATSILELYAQMSEFWDEVEAGNAGSFNPIPG